MNTTNYKFPRLKTLKCTVCGATCKGRQWWNRDDGFGLCPDCAAEEQEQLTPKEMMQNYGKVRVHYFLHKEGKFDA